MFLRRLEKYIDTLQLEVFRLSDVTFASVVRAGRWNLFDVFTGWPANVLFGI